MRAENSVGYRVVPFPVAREIIIDAGRLGTRRHIIHALLEIDVTMAREYLHAHKAATGETLSFTGWIIVCLGRAVEANKYADENLDNLIVQVERAINSSVGLT